MKNLLTLLTMALAVSLCSPDITPDPVPEPGPDPTPEPELKAPVLSLASQAITIYDAAAEQGSTLDFTLENGTADTEVTVAPAEGLEIFATLNKDLKGGVLSIKAVGEFTDGCKVTVTASNEAGEDTKELTINKYYLNLSCDNENIVIDNTLRTISCTTFRMLRDVQLSVDGNPDIYVKRVNKDWFKISEHLLMSVNWNDKQEARSETITLKIERVEYNYTVSQIAGEDEFELERKALIELWKALDGPNWNDHGSLGNCWAHNWNTELYPDVPLEDWYGVDVNQEWMPNAGHVTGIFLGDLNAFGEIPECIEDLRYLEVFECRPQKNLGCRKLTCKIPKAFGKLPNLKKLELDNNAFEEDLESSAIKDVVLNCPKLRDLGLANNNFTGRVPEWLAEIEETHSYTPDKSYYSISGNRLEGKVPEKVQQHWMWTRKYQVSSEGYQTWGEYFIKTQQPGYILYE